MIPHEPTIREFLRRLGHRVALIGRKPVADAPRSTVIWPAEQDDPADQAAWLARQYHAVYVNLNPLLPDLATALPDRGVSVCDGMIASRTRILIDVDGHAAPKALAREQAQAIKAELGPPLIESDTGNGYALIYTCALPNDDASRERVQTFLQSLKARHPCVDVSVFGAGRLTRVIGTLNRSCINGERIPTLLLNE